MITIVLLALEHLVNKLLGVICISFLLVACSNPPANKAPTVILSADVINGTTPFDVNFTATATDPEKDSLTYTWDFGDGSAISTGSLTKKHTYTTAGTHTAKLTVSDGKLSSSSTVDITAVAPPPNAFKKHIGDWVWVGTFANEDTFQGLVALVETAEATDISRNVVLGAWQSCSETFTTCSDDTIGALVLSEVYFASEKQWITGITFFDKDLKAKLVAIDPDGFGSEIVADSTFVGPGIWTTDSGADLNLIFGMSKLETNTALESLQKQQSIVNKHLSADENDSDRSIALEALFKREVQSIIDRQRGALSEIVNINN